MKILFTALALALVAGCSTKDPESAGEFFDAANEDYRNGALALAIRQYQKLLDQHPFSDHADEAELRIAHAHYLSADYPAAVIALTDFQRRHPTSEHLPFVGYLLGMCYVRQMSEVDRDQTAAQSAHTYFATLLHQYPDSPFAILAQLELGRCRSNLAGHELHVADFYETHGNRDAVEMRLLSVASRYGETEPAAEALLRLTRHYLDDGNTEHATLAVRSLAAEHPGSRQAIRARALLDEGDSAEVPPTTDPLDLLLIANGRRREPASFGTPSLPTLATKRDRPRFGGSGPATDPFDRGSPY